MYQLKANGWILNIDEGYVFSNDESNSAYQEYLKWLNEGNTAQAADIVIPQEVSMSQAREALLQSGLLSTVNTAVSQLSEKAQIQWEYRATVKRDNQFVQELVTNGVLTNAQLDDLFTLAASL